MLLIDGNGVKLGAQVNSDLLATQKGFLSSFYDYDYYIWL